MFGGYFKASGHVSGNEFFVVSRIGRIDLPVAVSVHGKVIAHTAADK